MVDSALLTGFAAVALSGALPLLFPAVGEIYSELSGVFNFGLEGIMLISAGASFLIATWFGNLYLAILIGALAGLATGLLVAFFSVIFRADQIVLAVGVLLLGTALSSYLVGVFAPTETNALVHIQTLPTLPIPYLSSIPIVGAAFDQNIMGYLGIVLVPVSWVVLFRTRWGLMTRMVGEDPLSADNMGIPVFRLRCVCVMIASMLSGLGGVFLILGTTGVWVDNITGGRGFIAVAIVRLAGWRPQWALALSLVFGVLDITNFTIQLSHSIIPPQFLQMIPDLGAILILLLATRIRIVSPPRSLGVPYVHGQK